MRYYIPTTTLNLNNILSSESISPAWVYSERRFGYARWVSVPEQPSENLVLLYTTPGSMSRPNEGMEDHPLLVEIETERLYEQLEEGIYYTDKTIYLSASNTRFIYETERSRSIALSLSDSSLETKLVALYKHEVESYHQVFRPVNCNLKGRVLNATDKELLLQHERRIDKLKGLLYGFYIGALLSKGRSHAEQGCVLRQMANLFSSIVSQNKVNGWVDELSREMLDNLLGKYKKLLLWDNLYQLSWSEIESQIAELNKQYCVSDFLSDLTNREPRLFTWLEGCRNKLQYKQSQESKKQKLEENVVLVSGKEERLLQLLPGIKDMPSFLLVWFNDVLLDERYNYRVSSYKHDLLKGLVVKAKEHISTQGQDWESSFERKHLNAMRRVATGEEQPYYDWTVAYTSALLAVVSRSDDWQKIAEYMEDLGLVDLRLAYAYYGVLYGFAGLPRDFTDVLYFSADKVYVSSLYAEIYRQLHDERITSSLGDLPVAHAEKPELSSLPWHDVEQELNTSAPDTEMGELKPSLREVVIPFLERVLKGTRNQNTSKEEIEDCLDKCRGQDLLTFMYTLKEYDGWSKSKKAWKSLLDALGIKSEYETRYSNVEPSARTKREVQSNNSLFLPSEIELSMLEDTSWWQETEKFISDRRALETYKKDIQWFVNNYNARYGDNKGEMRRGKYRTEPRDNLSVLNNFDREILNQALTSDKDWVRGHYEKIPRHEIMAYLRQKYGK